MESKGAGKCRLCGRQQLKARLLCEKQMKGTEREREREVWRLIIIMIKVSWIGWMDGCMEVK